jgi:hypothetical protein
LLSCGSRMLLVYCHLITHLLNVRYCFRTVP